MGYSWRSKGFHEQVKVVRVPSITISGIYPGVSNGIHISAMNYFLFSHQE
jgi:hypothetical protein